MAEIGPKHTMTVMYVIYLIWCCELPKTTRILKCDCSLQQKTKYVLPRSSHHHDCTSLLLQISIDTEPI